ncbi:asparagine synthase-related protein [Paenibacillus sp. HB172176]|uniref:asparagine synthase-related protein n=1 Tax=Paenibacillus sp. HB172176 TaxID=2493690 RepID=UPI00143C0832|nr:asparagine synthase-related protein [Paenibacillus sp. HB172176]
MSAISCIYHLKRQSLQPELGPRLMDALGGFPSNYIHAMRQDEIFLGCHGQWITAQSLLERLPIYHAESRLALTADAIIDNRAELLEQLGAAPSERDNMTDAMIILLSYLKWGEEAPKHLIGDFSFIIWDGRDRSLFGARDFSGSRTLYFARTDEHIAFSTLIRPLFTLPGIGKSLNEEWLSEFLAIPITTEAVDLFSTVYRQIEQVPPSHSFTVRDGRIAFKRYLTIRPEKKLKLKSNAEYEEAFREVFQTAISSKLRTYKEVGANLSGGLDSGSVVSFAARALHKENKKLHTFSYVPVKDFQDWTPRGRNANEKESIKQTVNHVGNIHDQYFDFADKNPLSVVDDWLDMMETPYKFYENSYWKKGIYEQAQKQGVGSLLTGSRGNWTVSWGPTIDYQAYLLRHMRWKKLYNEVNQYCANVNGNKARLYRVIGKKAFPSLAQRFSKGSEAELPDLINPAFADRTKVYERLEQHGYDFWGNSNQNVYEVRDKQFEKLYYWSVTGTAGCKQSLRHSLWERDATNDLRVIRFCLSLPEEQFVQNGYGRSLIRRATEHYLPDAIRLNQKYRGIQGADGLHRMLPAWNQLIEELETVVGDSALSEFLNMQQLKSALTVIKKAPEPNLIFQTEFRMLMRSLIFHRFIQKYA